MLAKGNVAFKSETRKKTFNNANLEFIESGEDSSLSNVKGMEHMQKDQNIENTDMFKEKFAGKVDPFEQNKKKTKKIKT